MAALKLWLQVLFLQGYLWREMLPEEFSDKVPQERSSAGLFNVLQLLMGLGMIANGVIWIAHGYGSAAFNVLFLTAGTGYVLLNVELFRLQRSFGSRALWTSWSWASGTLAIVGTIALIVASALEGIWVWLALFTGFITFCLLPGVNAIQRRYLFFSNPERYSHLITDPDIESLRDFWAETFWRLPRNVAAAMIIGPTEWRETLASDAAGEDDV